MALKKTVKVGKPATGGKNLIEQLAEIPPSKPTGIRGHIKLRLIRELAEGNKKQSELAIEYHVSQPAISQFARRHKAAIEAQRQNLSNELAGLWIADKKNRIAVLQDYVEEVNRNLYASKDPDQRGRLVKVGRGVLRDVAEELGQLPARIQINVDEGPIDYSINGVDMDKV